MPNSSRSLIVLALLTVLAVPASADLFTVTLTNGATFETRYQPIQSVVDEGKLQFLTDTGNWITLKKDNVASIASETESKGFGIVIDTQTIALGWDPTSIQEAEESQEGEDSTTQLLRYLVAQDQAQAPPPPPFSNELVVEPSDAGGIPIWMTGSSAPPVSNR
jgi:hypothetical protein